MYLTEIKSGKDFEVKIKSLDDDDYKKISKAQYYFNWKTEKGNNVYKLVLKDEVLGLLSCVHYKNEKRIEIRLLAVSKENRGKSKKYERITGTLIAFACKEAMKKYGIEGCVSLVPKTILKGHYMTCYGMLDAGRQVFLEGQSLLDILKEYEL
ncbi:hypothetical protein [Fluviicola taffensis]|uniref:N-acetyltransferase domain-containing protein n=1 Tax=Fluviicola taffensis (strain DSM 16823 / NCIMB 13979 / RW262) TaxID=755732 RepID=F2IDK5_FLUTR|nr:hypothetical protein [Fluviicola taffensis]AEA43378.1 hypothetical protein Fluta_1384 [Fluviicola taffensis DSM 16823]